MDPVFLGREAVLFPGGHKKDSRPGSVDNSLPEVREDCLGCSG